MIAALAGVGEGGRALAILDVGVGAGLHQRLDGGDVVRPAIAEHDRLVQRGPAAPVDVIERRVVGDQDAHDLDVAEMGGGAQGRAVIRSVVTLRALAPPSSAMLEHLDVVVDGRDGQDVVALGVERIGIGAEPEERARRRVMLAVDRDVQRRAAVRILDVHPLAGGDQALDLGDVAAGGGGMQAGIDLEVALARRRLGRRHAVGEPRARWPPSPSHAIKGTTLRRIMPAPDVSKVCAGQR